MTCWTCEYYDASVDACNADDLCYTDGYEKGKAETQKFVEDRCRKLGIDYTLIFTCESAD